MYEQRGQCLFGFVFNSSSTLAYHHQKSSSSRDFITRRGGCQQFDGVTVRRRGGGTLLLALQGPGGRTSAMRLKITRKLLLTVTCHRVSEGLQSSRRVLLEPLNKTVPDFQVV